MVSSILIEIIVRIALIDTSFDDSEKKSYLVHNTSVKKKFCQKCLRNWSVIFL